MAIPEPHTSVLDSGTGNPPMQSVLLMYDTARVPPEQSETAMA
eukprot:CAMPEP_0204292548 /NCGR_PEP_ID=MMETSP0468-20130131/64539_1 /ASSEMBLY_ACC=CAM_ASM_000383 /TAXON_ID=2969 /ORGANISM="Oxyrrhis marina" /LENGTH=42 /DNA_ID= /DNA_START= /DNA_END= /DNA_ORIENTATION=